MTSICSNNTYQQQQHYIMLQQQQHILQQQQHLQQQHQLIAPKMPLGNSQLQNMQQQQQPSSNVGPMLAKKKYNYNAMPYGGGEQQMPSVARRNARERNRVKQVNNGFVNLRQHLPQSVINNLSSGGRGASKKLSKVDTLRIAVEYIRGLQDMLDDGTGGPRPIYNSADESSNDGSYNDNDFSSVDSSPQFVNQLKLKLTQAHSYHSASPTPSYTDSDISGGYVKQELPDHTAHLKFESFDSFSDEQPDDEELLDYISSWQEQ